jgi:hypothetical protein
LHRQDCLACDRAARGLVDRLRSESQLVIARNSRSRSPAGHDSGEADSIAWILDRGQSTWRHLARQRPSSNNAAAHKMAVIGDGPVGRARRAPTDPASTTPRRPGVRSPCRWCGSSCDRDPADGRGRDRPPPRLGGWNSELGNSSPGPADRFQGFPAAALPPLRPAALCWAVVPP